MSRDLRRISHSPRHPAARSPLTAVTAVMFRFGLFVVLALPLNAWAGSDTASASAAQATAACSATGLDPSEAPFAYCVRSLQQSSANRQLRNVESRPLFGRDPDRAWGSERLRGFVPE